MTTRTFTLYPCTWYDGTGWQWEGYADRTPAGCVAEAVTYNEPGVTLDDIAGAVFIDGTTGAVISGHIPYPSR
jgi:hypothetical protein